jgi:hypothetical protein
MSEALVNEIATTLQESNLEQLRKVVEVIGVERASEFFQKTLEAEANGGLMVRKGDRRRTPGGVFFYLVRTGVAPAERKQIFPNFNAAGEPRGSGQPQPPPPEPLNWQEARAIAVKLLTMQKGETTVKVTLIGRPKQVGKQKGAIFCIMEGRGAPSSLPKGLPAPPPETKQNVVVFIAEKQWGKVEGALKESKEDALIVEGWPYFDPARQMTVVLAQSATTKNLQRAKRQNTGGAE